MRMKKRMSALAVLLCAGFLGGCGNAADLSATTPPATAGQSASMAAVQGGAAPATSSYADAYSTLAAFKTDNYAAQSVANFNAALAGEDDNLGALFELYSVVLEELPNDDANTGFFRVTLDCSLGELYCEQMGEAVAYTAFVRYVADPIEPLNEEERAMMEGEEPAYAFLFTASYNLFYSLPNPNAVTVGERDAAILQFQAALQAYVDDLGKAGLSTGDIRAALTQKAGEIAESLSNEKIILTAEISNIERHDSGEDSAI